MLSAPYAQIRPTRRAGGPAPCDAAGRPATPDLLLGGGLRPLPPPSARGLQQGRNADLSVVPDAEPCPPHPRSPNRRRAARGAGRSAPPLHEARQRARGLARPSVAGPLRLL